MKGYAVHLLFHLLAIVCGAAAGIAGAMWWFRGVEPALWAGVAALALGVVVLVVEWRTINAAVVPDEPRPRTATRTDLPAAPLRTPGGAPRTEPPTRRV